MIPRVRRLPAVPEFIRDLGLRLGLLTAKPGPLIPTTEDSPLDCLSGTLSREAVAGGLDMPSGREKGQSDMHVFWQPAHMSEQEQDGRGCRKHWEVGTGVEGMATKERDGFKFPTPGIIKAIPSPIFKGTAMKATRTVTSGPAGLGPNCAVSVADSSHDPISGVPQDCRK